MISEVFDKFDSFIKYTDKTVRLQYLDNFRKIAACNTLSFWKKRISNNS